MSTYQIVLRNTVSAFEGHTPVRLYGRFLDWWVSLYEERQRNPLTQI